MYESYENGYRITGNHAKQGREYHVCNSAGVVCKGDCVADAIAKAGKRTTGDVVPPVVEPVVVEVDDTDVISELVVTAEPVVVDSPLSWEPVAISASGEIKPLEELVKDTSKPNKKASKKSS